jgi:murein DD-endopeptidase MepM/ murein hydrolase activator NlpD
MGAPRDNGHLPVSWRTALVIVGLSFCAGALTAIYMDARVAQMRLASDRAATSSASTVPAPEAPSDSQPPAAARDPASAVATTGVVNESVVDMLRRRSLRLPVDGVQRSALRDTYTDPRAGARSHEAIDIVAARRTPVRAADDGTIEKLFTSKAGGLTVYEFEPSDTFCYYYAHLDAYADGLHEGQTVKKGDLLGYVGSTGDASPDAPHLHFSIFRLTPEHQWWKGEPIDPYLVLR